MSKGRVRTEGQLAKQREYNKRYNKRKREEKLRAEEALGIYTKQHPKKPSKPSKPSTEKKQAAFTSGYSVSVTQEKLYTEQQYNSLVEKNRKLKHLLIALLGDY
jgi:hypothetical protein